MLAILVGFTFCLSASQVVQAVEAERTILASATNETLKMTLTAPANYVAGHEMALKIAVSNQGNSAIRYRDSRLNDFTFEVRCNNNPVSPTRLYQSITNTLEVTRMPHSNELKPGINLEFEVNLVRLFDFSVSGDYEITARWDGAVEGKVPPFRKDGLMIKVHVVEKIPPAIK